MKWQVKQEKDFVIKMWKKLCTPTIYLYISDERGGTKIVAPHH